MPTGSDRPRDCPLHKLICVVISELISDRGYASSESDQHFLAQSRANPKVTLEESATERRHGAYMSASRISASSLMR